MPGNDKSKRYVKDLTGGLDLDTPFHECAKDALADAINVTISNNRRKRGQLIPCIGTTLSNYNFHSKVENGDVSQRMIDFHSLTPIGSVALSECVGLVCTDHDPNDLNGKEQERVCFYCVYPHEKRHELDNTVYDVHELYETPWLQCQVGYDTSMVGFTHNGTDTLVLSSHTIPVSWIDLNPETQNTLTSIYNQRVSKDGDWNNDIVINGITRGSSTAVPGITRYTYRVQYNNDSYSSFAPLTDAVIIPPSYGSDPRVFQWSRMARMGAFGSDVKDEIEWQGAMRDLTAQGPLSRTLLHLNIDLTGFTSGRLVHVYALRYFNAPLTLSNPPSMVSKIAVVPFPPSQDRNIQVTDGNQNILDDEFKTAQQVIDQIPANESFYARSLCVKRTMLFAANIIEEKQNDTKNLITSYDTRIYQFNRGGECLARSHEETEYRRFTMDDLCALSVEETSSLLFRQNDCMDGLDSIAYRQGTAQNYCMHTYDHGNTLAHGAEGPNIRVQFATGTMIYGGLYPDFNEIGESHSTVCDTKAMANDSAGRMTDPEFAFARTVRGCCPPSLTPGSDGSGWWTEGSIGGRSPETDYVIATPENLGGSRMVDRRNFAHDLSTSGHSFGNPSFSHQFKCLQHDSVYRLGCSFIYADGSESDVRFMGDIRTPSMSHPAFRLFDANMPVMSELGNKETQEYKSKEGYTYSVTKMTEMYMYPLYLFIWARDVPKEVKAIVFYYSPREEDDRNVSQTGVFTKTARPMNNAQLTNEFFKAPGVASLPPLPMIDHQQWFYGGIVNKSKPHFTRQMIIGCPEEGDWSACRNELAKSRDEKRWAFLDYLYGYPVRVNDPEYTREIAGKDVCVFLSPETDTTDGDYLPLVPVHDRSFEDYQIHTHGILTSLFPASHNRVMVSAAYTRTNDLFDTFWCFPFERHTDENSIYDYTHHGNDSRHLSSFAELRDRQINFDSFPAQHHLGGKPGSRFLYDTLYMADQYSLNRLPRLDDTNPFDVNGDLPCLLSFLVSQEQRAHNDGRYDEKKGKLTTGGIIHDGVGHPVGEGIAPRCLKYFIFWDTVPMYNQRDNSLSFRYNFSLGYSNSNLLAIQTIPPGVTTHDDLFSLLVPCSNKRLYSYLESPPEVTSSLRKHDLNGIARFMNLIPSWSGKILPNHSKLRSSESEPDLSYQTFLLSMSSSRTACHALTRFTIGHDGHSQRYFTDKEEHNSGAMLKSLLETPLSQRDANLTPLSDHGQILHKMVENEEYHVINHVHIRLGDPIGRAWNDSFAETIVNQWPRRGSGEKDPETKDQRDGDVPGYWDPHHSLIPSLETNSVFPDVTWVNYGKLLEWYDALFDTASGLDDDRKIDERKDNHPLWKCSRELVWKHILPGGNWSDSEVYQRPCFTLDYFCGLNHHGYGGGGVAFIPENQSLHSPGQRFLPTTDDNHSDWFWYVEGKDLEWEVHDRGPLPDKTYTVIWSGTCLAGNTTKGQNVVFDEGITLALPYGVSYRIVSSSGVNNPRIGFVDEIQHPDLFSFRIMVEEVDLNDLPDPPDPFFPYLNSLEVEVTIHDTSFVLNNKGTCTGLFFNSLLSSSLVAPYRFTTEQNRNLPEPPVENSPEHAQWERLPQNVLSKSGYQVLLHDTDRTLTSSGVIEATVNERKIRPGILRKALKGGSHCYFSTLRRKIVPYENKLPFSTQWTKASILGRDRDGEFKGTVTNFDSYCGIWYRQYTGAFYPDGNVSVEHANASSSPTIMAFPYEGRVNPDFVDPVLPLRYPSARDGYTNTRAAIKRPSMDRPPFTIMTSLLSQTPFLVRFRQEDGMYDTLKMLYRYAPLVTSEQKTTAARQAYAAKHETRIMYAHFDFMSGHFLPFSRKDMLDLDMSYGPINHIMSYKQQMVAFQDRATTITIPDLPVMLQEANAARQAAAEAMSGGGGTTYTPVVMGTSEVFSMKGQPASLYGSILSGSRSYYATTEHVFWVDVNREAICVFDGSKVSNISAARNVASWTRDVSRLVRQGKGTIVLYENRDSTLRLCYKGEGEVMTSDTNFLFDNDLSRNVIELNEKQMTFTSFISANHDVAVKFRGRNVFFHKQKENRFDGHDVTHIADEGLYNGFFYPNELMRDMTVTAPICPAESAQVDCNFYSVMFYDISPCVRDLVVDYSTLSESYMDVKKSGRGQLWNYANTLPQYRDLKEGLATDQSADRFGSLMTLGLRKGASEQENQVFRDRVLFVRLRFQDYWQHSTDVRGNRPDTRRRTSERWTLEEMRNFFFDGIQVSYEPVIVM